MNKNNCILLVFFSLLNIAGVVFSMDPELKSIDKVFLLACKNNKPIKFALDNGANIEAVNPSNRYTGLHYACESGNLSSVNFFLKNGLDVYVFEKDLPDPIAIALKAGHQEVAQLLLDRQLLIACSYQNLPFNAFRDYVKILLSRGANINSCRDSITLRTDDRSMSKDTVTPLLEVCSNGDIDKIKFLLDNGADINQKSIAGHFPLYIALCTEGFKEDQRRALMHCLIDRGADLTLRGPSNHTILQAAVAGLSDQDIKFLINKAHIDLRLVDDHNFNAVHEAILYGKEHILKILLDAGIPIEKDRSGLLPIYYAIQRGDDHIVELLIKKGLDVNGIDLDGQTPLHYASQFGHLGIVNMFLKEGAVQVADRDGKTPLQLSQAGNHKRVIKLLQHSKPSAKKVTVSQVVIAPEKVTKLTKAIKKLKVTQKNNKSKKKKKSNPIKSILQQDTKITIEEKQSYPEQEIVAESSIQEIKQVSIPQVADNPILNKLVNDSQGDKDATHKPKKTKYSLMNYVQKKAAAVLTPEATAMVTTSNTYADVVKAYKVNRVPHTPVKRITIFDDNLTITALPPKNALSLMPKKAINPLLDLPYSEHVEEKKNNPFDHFHNFSTRIEQELGCFAHSTIIEPPTKKHSATVEHTIPATVQVGNSQTQYPGKFRFIEQDGSIKHRLFEPDKNIGKMSNKKSSSLLMLPQ